MDSPKPRAIRLVVAGGGTGGHLFPGIAITQEIMHRNPASRVLFIGTDKPFEKDAVARAGFTHRSVSAEGIKGRGLWRGLRASARIPVGLVQALGMLHRFRPDLVLGVGGYSSAPVVLGAWLLGIRTALHEQNLLPGITNRMLSHVADRIYVTFAETADRLGPAKSLVTGNPVRREFIADEENRDSGAVAGKPLFTVLIVGGSQGAHAINRAVIDALPLLRDRRQFRFIHQTGSADETPVRTAYGTAGVSGNAKPFFHDMARNYRQADLVVCRAGATTVAEVTAIGKGILFIPFPHAADDHQRLNAGALVDEGAAEMIMESELTGALLAQRIQFYADHPDALRAMGRKAAAFGRPDAAAVIVDDCYRQLINP
ncbi:UDP-N-acetylglucosamine--N-acetylmuramyl-(pentapeptide) pyrophosphoryl-undecaprenol N-acetylglucosamine transferase (EC [Olavius algarvensis associated proteobacterium Delta 3]|nr:UDP-N-acetylglucosamine--N-acetylmuramyl-(pentapeptide) pyrophosphoryl-undecaprenol N-acetylglucosamine transferase (EC [Olavius algarvensis associated proteobacterium Delta 3]CAB5130601.1 UDP-N-acetylglucosamine--N-acetylmuramyl-(pentapeptide) pyrophosphoryl-undecaprenol N-acetylglucosamine transferase (EC [Olavius algarvensis associated proteobacterium Delta 3]